MPFRVWALLAVLPWLAAAQTRGDAFAHLKKGSEHLQRNEVEDAVRECKAAVALDPQSAAAHMLLGQAYLAQRSISMVAEAKAELQQALDLDPGLLWARFYLAKVYIDLGRFEKAREELEAGLKQRPNVPHFLSLLGEAKRRLGDPEGAIEMQHKALAADPSMTPAHYYAALAYIDMKREDDAVRELESAVGSRFVSVDMYLTLGSIYTRRKQYREAEDVCRKAIALEPSRSESYVNLAQLYNVQGLSDKALAAIKRALPEGRNFPVTAYYQKLQADAFYETGRAWHTKGKLREAAQAYLKSLAYDGNRAETHQRLAEALLDSGDRAAAREHADAAEKLGSPVSVAVRERLGR